MLLLAGFLAPCHAADDTTFLLAAELAQGDTSRVKVTLDVGGDLIVSDETGTKKLPLTVTAELRYHEHLLIWSADPTQPARSWRDYQTATAKIQVDEGGLLRELPQAKSSIVAEVRGGHTVLVGTETPLTRDQLDLVNVVGNTLSLNRLLPGRRLAESESWDHGAAAIGALLGMDHVAICEVRSVVTGNVNRQVQIRLAGTVHGTIDGAPTEMQLRGAYLFHEQEKCITKFNLAIKETRTASQVVPGLDVVAKVSVTVRPGAEASTAKFEGPGRDVSKPLANTLLCESTQNGYQFHYDPSWYVTAEQRDLMSLRLQQGGNLTAHCNVTTLPARSKGRETTLEEFERDVRESLSDKLETVSASTQWTTAQGHECLGVVGQGQVEDVPIEWRYYLVASPGLPRVSLAVTVEQSMIKQFNDADRQIIESLELIQKPVTAASRTTPSIQ